MNTQDIIDFLGDNDISEIEELKSDDESIILKLYYDFDQDETSAARAYANEESDVEEDSDEWYRDWYLAYLYDIAKDTLEEILEEMNEEFNTSSLLKIIPDNASSSEYMKFAAIVCSEEYEEDLEEELNDYV
ncbi:MAG: hypothetical protein K5986_00780 [Clostridium sp.]|nr:hypothetical protein [Clostridium sp.]